MYITKTRTERRNWTELNGHGLVYKKSFANAEGNSGACLNFESPVKQNQSPEGARQPAAIYL